MVFDCSLSDHVIHHKNEEYIKDIPANSTFHVQGMLGI